MLRLNWKIKLSSYFFALTLDVLLFSSCLELFQVLISVVLLQMLFRSGNCLLISVAVRFVLSAQWSYPHGKGNCRRRVCCVLFGLYETSEMHPECTNLIHWLKKKKKKLWWGMPEEQSRRTRLNSFTTHFSAPPPLFFLNSSHPWTYAILYII